MESQTSKIMPGIDRLPKPVDGLRIAETFTSLQGEGRLTGTRSFFIRTSGCNLRCWFCDTPYASWSPEGQIHRVDALVAAAVDSGCQYVVLTGGEPLLPQASAELVQRLRAHGLHVTIETAGTIDRALTADLMSISPKLAGSGPQETQARSSSSAWALRHEQRRWRPEVVRQLIARSCEYQIKFVVDRPSDFEQAADAARELGVACEHVWIMPQATSVEQLDQQAIWLKPLCQQHGFQYCDRMHVRWYGHRRGT
jgi:7-carboxy-7-deazaguanine synthase